MTLLNVTELPGNIASIGAGGMFNSGTATLTDSTISGNTAQGYAGLGIE